MLRDALIVMIPESNLPVIAVELEKSLRRDFKIQNLTFMTEDKGNDNARDMPGSVTTARKKKEMVYIMIHTYMKNYQISFSSDFVWVIKEQQSIESVYDEFIQQLRKFSQKRIVTRNHHENTDQVHFAYSGKMCGANDDFVMALLIAVYHQRVFFDDEKYQMYRFGAI